MTDIMCWQIRNFLGPRLDSVVFHISYFVFLWHSSPPAGSFWAWHWFLFVFVFLRNSSALLRWAMALGEENALIDLLLRSDGFCLYFYSYLYFCLHLYCICTCIYNCMKFLHPPGVSYDSVRDRGIICPTWHRPACCHYVVWYLMLNCILLCKEIQ